MENNREVLLSISNLKQQFPLKKGRFVKANDGVSLDIYRGETFGLVGESGCGKSTLGRTVLQLYHQTYGRTMYYGRSLDELAPKYVEQTIKNLSKLRTEWKALEQKKEKIDEEYKNSSTLLLKQMLILWLQKLSKSGLTLTNQQSRICMMPMHFFQRTCMFLICQ